MNGKGEENKGRIKEAAGAFTGNKKLKVEGKIDQAAGKLSMSPKKSSIKPARLPRAISYLDRGIEQTKAVASIFFVEVPYVVDSACNSVVDVGIGTGIWDCRKSRPCSIGGCGRRTDRQFASRPQSRLAVR